MKGSEAYSLLLSSSEKVRAIGNGTTRHNLSRNGVGQRVTLAGVRLSPSASTPWLQRVETDLSALQKRLVPAENDHRL